MNKTIDWTEKGRCLRVQLVCCTCSACHSFNTLEKTDLFGEPYTMHYCTRHDKEVHPEHEPCADFK